MAFQAPQRQQPKPRSYSVTAPEAITTTAPAAPQPQQRQSPRQSAHDWIVFSPPAPSESYDCTDSTIRTDRILAQVSDFGSLGTAAVSEKHRRAAAQDADQQHDDQANRETEAGHEDLDDADSLDDGLHAFNEPSIGSDQRILINQTGDTVLPTHDGLGMFPGSSSPLQEQFWQHEKYNPRRRRQSVRRSGLQRRFEALEEQVEQITEEEKVQRIEKWRIEQSQAILEEIERETRRRRRRKSRASASRSQRNHSSQPSDLASTVSKPQVAPAQQPPSTERLSFWERLTRSFIRNLIGIDDATLEFIFGESLPPEVAHPSGKPSLASELIDHAERTIPNDGTLAASTESWEQRLLTRISKELGILLGHISEHPGAFTSYLRTRETPAYAGLASSSTMEKSTFDPSSASAATSKTSTTTVKFGPTLANHQQTHRPHQHRQSITTTDPSLWGIEEEDEDRANADVSQPSPSPDEAARLQHEREYWERDLDVKMVFGFLRDRFTSSSSTDPAPSTQPQQYETRQFAQPRSLSRPNATPLHLNTTPTTPTHSNLQSHSARNADSLRRAALIRHHHPLVSRNIAASQTTQNQSRSRAFSSATPLSPILGRRPSCAADTESCASQSTKRSKTAHSSDSRNFWDIGGGTLGAASVSWGLV